MRFILFVEGRLEYVVLPAFLKRWLDPRLNQSIRIEPDRLNGGWGTFLNEGRRRAHQYFAESGSEQTIAVIGLLDLYTGRDDEIYPKRLSSAEERYRWGIREIETRINHPQFRMFFVVHELEAWILSQPNLLPASVRQLLPDKTKHPETVNFDEPPAKLLDRLYEKATNRSYEKIRNGVDIFKNLDPNTAYEKCPHLKQMLDTMLQMAKDAGC